MQLPDDERKKQQNLRKKKQRDNDRKNGFFEETYKCTIAEHENLKKYLAELRLNAES